MSVINLLPSKVYNRIAAGEVVEKPSSVVKELVENSLDANASSIVIEIVSGGKTLIKVSDNGDGISKDQIKKALLSHATSKISCVDDLNDIRSLGFRGEALPSIASVSKLKITSKPRDQELGAYVTCAGGIIDGPYDVGFVDGTEIEVNNLFFNTPARERFLKTDRTEEAEISSLVQRFVLCNPNVSFKYIADGDLILQSFGDGIESAFLRVYGLDALKNCYYLNSEKNGIKIEGYVGKHHFTKSNRGYQSLFLNGRYIIDSTISSAITNAFSSYLMKRQYPFYVLSITIPSDLVDVNVHPNKLSVRFANNGIVYGTVYSVISKLLDGSKEVVEVVKMESQKGIIFTKEKEQEYVRHNNKIQFNNDDLNLHKLVFRDSGSNSIEFKEEINNKKDSVVDIFAENKAYIEKLEQEKAQKKVDNATKQESIIINRDLIFVGQALHTYLIYEDGLDLFLVDQHAAHERLIFDKLMDSFKNKSFEIQSMLIPYILTVNNLEFEFLQDKIRFLNDFGFEIEVFGRNAFKVSSIPVLLSQMNLEKFFFDILADLNQLKEINTQDLFYEKIAQKACKSAIKSGDKLSKLDIDYLTEKLKNNLSLKCPHGRPVCIKITNTEIEKWFKRIV